MSPTTNANMLHAFNYKTSNRYLVKNNPNPTKVETKPWTAEEIADFRAFLRSGLTEEEYDKRKAEGTL